MTQDDTDEFVAHYLKEKTELLSQITSLNEKKEELQACVQQQAAEIEVGLPLAQPLPVSNCLKCWNGVLKDAARQSVVCVCA